ncbi:sugar ABC transporter permease [Kribbella sp. NPDC050459]|uniref:carbohydrate ABC transporter permease n=1 Tax=Kribbella sp. NPDC050459 TaxID=3155785 RepID=UPI003401D47B
MIFGYFSWGPIARGLLLAFQKTNLVTPALWVGLDNFHRVLQDPLLVTAARNSLWFAILSAVIGFPLPILLALHIAELRRTRGLATVLAYLPAVIPPVVSVLLWKQLFQPDGNGLFNTVLGWFGFGPEPWLQSAASAMPSIVLQATWAGFGSSAVIYVAALMSVNPDLYDAAELDGASIARRTWHITLPQIRGVMVLMLLLQLIGTLQVFTEPFLMTGGGPNNSTVTLLMLIYRYAFVNGDFGGASALSVLLALSLAVISLLYFRLSRRWEAA